MNFKFYQKNPHLVGKSMSELLTLDYTLYNGFDKGVIFYDNETGAKRVTDYFYNDDKGSKHLEIRKCFNDIFDNNNNVVAIEVKHNLIPTTGDWGVKVELVNNQEKVLVVLEKRRERIKSYLIAEARVATNPLVVPIFDIVFAYLNTEISTWITTGKADLLYYQIDNAPTTPNDNVTNVFIGTPYEGQVNSIADLFELDMEKTVTENELERPMKLNEYLKHYIK